MWLQVPEMLLIVPILSQHLSLIFSLAWCVRPPGRHPQTKNMKVKGEVALHPLPWLLEQTKDGRAN